MYIYFETFYNGQFGKTNSIDNASHGLYVSSRTQYSQTRSDYFQNNYFALPTRIPLCFSKTLLHSIYDRPEQLFRYRWHAYLTIGIVVPKLNRERTGYYELQLTEMGSAKFSFKPPTLRWKANFKFCFISSRQCIIS